MAVKIKDHLESGKPLSVFSDKSDGTYHGLNQEMRFLSAKPVIYAANISEEYLINQHPDITIISKIAKSENAEIVQISAQIESDLNQINDVERNDYMELLGNPIMPICSGIKILL